MKFAQSMCPFCSFTKPKRHIRILSVKAKYAHQPNVKSPALNTGKQLHQSDKHLVRQVTPTNAPTAKHFLMFKQGAAGHSKHDAEYTCVSAQTGNI